MDDFTKELLEAQEQRSQGWRDARAGKFTASEIWKLMTNPRTKSKDWSETAITYIETKVGEEITGLVHQESNAYPLVWGEEQEPIAKEVFKIKKGIEIKRAGFVPFTDHSGGTPDGYINDDIVVEIKCPYNSATFVSYLQLNSMEDVHDNFPKIFWQLQANMVFSKREKGLFIAYDPRFPDDRQIKTIEFERHEVAQMELLDRLERAIEKKLELLKLLK